MQKWLVMCKYPILVILYFLMPGGNHHLKVITALTLYFAGDHLIKSFQKGFCSATIKDYQTSRTPHLTYAIKICSVLCSYLQMQLLNKPY